MNAVLDSIRECIPSRISDKNGLSKITWLQATGERLSEPFYYQTLEKLARKSVPQFETELEMLESLAELPKTKKPDAFIFHMSRCGSTLLTNCLRSIGDSICVCEAEIFTQLLMPYSQINWLAKKEKTIGSSADAEMSWENKRARLLRGAMNVFGARASSTQSRFFVKFTSWNVLFIQTIRNVFPDVPCWFVYRNPLEVMASNLARHPRWWRLRFAPEECQAYFGGDSQTTDASCDEEFCARCLHAFCNAILDAIDDRTLLFRYEKIDRHFISEIAISLGAHEDEIDTQRLHNILTTYSKDSTGSEIFIPDGDNKRRHASEAAREYAKLILEPVIAKLDRLENSRRKTFIHPSTS